jgi:hypothetical protein
MAFRVGCGGDFHGRDEVFLAVGARYADRELASGEITGFRRPSSMKLRADAE